jgi:glutathione S-transferase
MAILNSHINVELREVTLKNKPQAMLDASPKASVPVLVCADNRIIDESLDIMLWALQQNDPDDWLGATHQHEINSLIKYNDCVFKPHLDHYKYSARFPEHTTIHYRDKAEAFLQQLEARLNAHTFLVCNKPCLADVAVFPFIRQFAYVDINWFKNTPYVKLIQWLSHWLDSDIFSSVMQKYPLWSEHQSPLIF